MNFVCLLLIQIYNSHRLILYFLQKKKRNSMQVCLLFTIYVSNCDILNSIRLNIIYRHSLNQNC